MAEETEVIDETTEEVSDEQATEDAIEEAEPKTFTQEQFSGLLRDKQAGELAHSQTRADLAASRLREEELRQQAEVKPDVELSEEEAAEPVNRGELHNFRRNLVDEITKSVSKKTEKDKVDNINQQKAEDATSLVKSHTVKSKGQGLDARTVIDEGAPYLAIHHKTQYEAAMRSSNCASELYNLSIALVPEIRARAETRRNLLLAKKLDESGDTPPSGGGSAPTGGDESILMSILDGSMPESELDKLMGRGV